MVVVCYSVRMKNAYHSDYLYYDGALLMNVWLLVDESQVVGYADNCPDEYKQHKFENSGIFPALINTHTHAAMSLLRGYADDLPLDIWLNEHIWPAEKRLLSADFIRDGLKLAVCELIHSGVSCINDMYFYSDIEADILSSIGLRGVVGCAMFGDIEANLNKSKELVEKYQDNLLINIAICPHAPYTATPDVYKAAVKFCQKHNTLMHTHLSETAREISDTVSKYGKRPVELMDSVGAFDCHSIFAHCVHLDDNEIAFLGSKKASIAHCPHSNMKLASGFAPIQKLLNAGANVTIATDGASSNNDLDMLAEIQTAALLQKAFMNDPTAFNAETAFVSATRSAAEALHLDNIGTIKSGKQADFIVVSYNSSNMQPVYNPLSNLIYSANKGNITDMFVAGRQLMKDKTLTTINESDVLATAKMWRDKIKTTK
ncbi:TRZ/ATZ family hydrolase [Deferribacterales bacterium RsTz2092]|nr:N-ethylammeline chlorohydrolase [Deferribacterales bacterium]